jgi:hypothetical protein
MSRFIEGEARTQSLLFPERLEDWIEESNRVRINSVLTEHIDDVPYSVSLLTDGGIRANARVTIVLPFPIEVFFEVFG